MAQKITSRIFSLNPNQKKKKDEKTLRKVGGRDVCVRVMHNASQCAVSNQKIHNNGPYTDNGIIKIHSMDKFAPWQEL